MVKVRKGHIDLSTWIEFIVKTRKQEEIELIQTVCRTTRINA